MLITHYTKYCKAQQTTILQTNKENTRHQKQYLDGVLAGEVTNIYLDQWSGRMVQRGATECRRLAAGFQLQSTSMRPCPLRCHQRCSSLCTSPNITVNSRSSLLSVT